MTYTKTTWVDEILADVEEYEVKDDGGSVVYSGASIALATAVIQAGTSVNAAVMQNIEDGIETIDGDLSDYLAIDTLSFTLPMVIGNGVSVPATGPMLVGIAIPANCIINRWELVGNASGSIVLDVWKDTFANYPPTVADTIISTSKPTLSSARTAGADITTTEWPLCELTKGDYLLVKIDSVATLTQVMLTLYCTKVA